MKDQLRQLSRRDVLRLGLLGGAGLLVACGKEIPKPKVEEEPEEIKTARKLQQEALARGEFKFPLPRVITELDGIKWENYEARFSGLPSEAKQVLIELPSPNPKKNLLFPALVEGKIIEVYENPYALTSVKIQMGNQIWSFSAQGNPLIKEGNKVPLGEPIFNLDLQVPNPVKPGEFLRNVIFIGAYHVGETIEQSRLTLDNILKYPDSRTYPAVLIPNRP